MINTHLKSKQVAIKENSKVRFLLRKYRLKNFFFVRMVADGDNVVAGRKWRYTKQTGGGVVVVVVVMVVGRGVFQALRQHHTE